MDSSELASRLVTTALIAFATAATTSSLLAMFQESASVTKMKQEAREAEIVGENGPIAKGIPRVGDASLLFPDFIGGLNKLAANARSASPHGLGWFDNMGHPFLVLSNADHAKQLLNRITAHALWGGIKPASEAFFGKSVLFVLEGEEWKRLRYLLRDSFKMQKLDTLSRDVTTCATALANRLDEFCDQTVDMNQAFALYHLAAVGKSSYDFDMNVMQHFPQPGEIASAFEYLLNELPRRSFHPDAGVREDYVSANEDNIKWHRASKTVRDMVRETIVQRLQDEAASGSSGVGKRGDLLDSMIASYRASASPAVTGTSMQQQAELLTDALGDNLVEVFFAGYGTSTVAMSVGLYHLAKNRKLMAQAHREVDSVLDADLKFNQESLNAKMFPFLCRVFNEALRLVPPAPLAARITTEDLVLGGIKIPTGTVTWIPVSFYHSDPQAWGSTVNEFDPSRWEKPLVSPASFAPFSGGARDCIGKHFAELESVVALAVLLKSFDFDVDPEFELAPLFTGFGTRAGNARTNKVCTNLIPRKRTDTSQFIYDWTPQPGARGRKDSNPLLSDADYDFLPQAPSSRRA